MKKAQIKQWTLSDRVIARWQEETGTRRSHLIFVSEHGTSLFGLTQAETRKLFVGLKALYRD